MERPRSSLWGSGSPLVGGKKARRLKSAEKRGTIFELKPAITRATKTPEKKEESNLKNLGVFSD